MFSPGIRIPRFLWEDLISQLHRRTEGFHESGAFLLKDKGSDGRLVSAVTYYDELDQHAYSSGACILHADAFGRLWSLCAANNLTVLADIHVHPFGAGQSKEDRENPMIARAGHVAIILPSMAKPPIPMREIGIYEYQGGHRWQTHSGPHSQSFLQIGDSA